MEEEDQNQEYIIASFHFEHCSPEGQLQPIPIDGTGSYETKDSGQKLLSGINIIGTAVHRCKRNYTDKNKKRGKEQ